MENRRGAGRRDGRVAATEEVRMQRRRGNAKKSGSLRSLFASEHKASRWNTSRGRDRMSLKRCRDQWPGMPSSGIGANGALHADAELHVLVIFRPGRGKSWCRSDNAFLPSSRLNNRAAIIANFSPTTGDPAPGSTSPTQSSFWQRGRLPASLLDSLRPAPRPREAGDFNWGTSSRVTTVADGATAAGTSSGQETIRIYAYVCTYKSVYWREMQCNWKMDDFLRHIM